MFLRNREMAKEQIEVCTDATAKKVQKKARGFTLIELIVVIVIMGILTAVAVGAFTKYIGQSKTASDKNSTETVVSAIDVAAADDAVVNALLTATTANDGATAATLVFTTSGAAGTYTAGTIAAGATTLPDALQTAMIEQMPDDAGTVNPADDTVKVPLAKAGTAITITVKVRCKTNGVASLYTVVS